MCRVKLTGDMLSPGTSSPRECKIRGGVTEDTFDKKKKKLNKFDKCVLFVLICHNFLVNNTYHPHYENLTLASSDLPLS